MQKNILRKMNRWDRSIFLILLCALGFPGNYTQLLGAWLNTVTDYTCFFLEILIMFCLSGGKLLTARKSLGPVYLFLAVVTVLSLAVNPQVLPQTISCVRLCVTAAFALWLAVHYPIDRLMKLLCLAQTLFIALSLLFVVMRSDLALQSSAQFGSAFRGLYSTKNTCATELSFLMLPALWLWRREKGHRLMNRYAVLLAVQFVLLLWCQALGPLLCVVAVDVYLLFFSWFRFHPGWLLVVGSTAFLLLAMTVLPKLAPLLVLLGKDTTLTGRTMLWEQVFSVIKSTHFFTGYGYGAFWENKDAYYLVQRGFDAYSYFGNMRSGAHNLVLELWLNIGLIGVLLFFYMLLHCFRGYRRLSSERYLLVSGFMLMYTVHGLTERALDNSSYSTLLLFFCIGLASQANIRRKRLDVPEVIHGN